MSSLLTEALSLCNLAAVGIFGIVLSAAFCEIEWTRRHKLLLMGCTILMLALQGVVSLRWGTGLARYLYPLITHLPLWLLLAAMTRRALWPLVSVLTAYLCCQLRRWAALLVIALFPAGGTVLQDATELIVTLPILLVLIRWIAPSVRALSRSPLLLQLQFGMIPLLSYLFDYFTRIYTDLLSSGNQAAVEFMPFVCSLAYLGFVLHTTQEQQLRSQLEQTRNSLNLQVAQAVREIEAMRESQRKASTYRHDLRHHLQYLSACIENGRTEAAQEYIHSVCAEIEASKVNVYCENEAANLILSSFAARAQHDGIDFRVHAAIPLILPLPDSDLCVLFSNALENALHARAAPEAGRKTRCCGDHRLRKERQAVCADRKLLLFPGPVRRAGRSHHQSARPRPWRAQHLRHCGAIRRHVQLCPAAGSVCAAHFPVKGRFNAFYGRFMPNTLLPHILCYSKLRRLYCRPILLL